MESNERVPPFSEEAERGVIGSALLDSDVVIPEAITKHLIVPDAFYMPAFRAIWEAMVTLYEARKPVDLITVSDQLLRNGTLDRIGGAVVLNRIVDATPTSAHAGYYCEIVRKKWSARTLIDLCRQVERDAYTAQDEEAVVCAAPDRFLSIVSTPKHEQTNAELMAESGQAWRDASDGKKKAIGLETPWRGVTYMTCGIELGLTIIAGRPSAGKTTAENQLADWFGFAGVPGYRVTLDSTRKELLERSQCREAEASLPKLKFGFGSKKQHADIAVAATRLSELPMHIDDKTRDIAQIRSRARAMKARYGIRYMTVDYIQLVRAEEMGRAEWDVVRRVTHVSAMLKDLSFELGIPIIVLSQLSRAVEKEGRDPQLSDLRDSGAIEQDANKVLFLYVDLEKKKAMEKASPGATKHKRPVIWNLMKHKGGETGLLPMWLYPPYFRFQPAKHDAKSGVMFMDDDLPLSRANDQRELESAPEYMPKAEQVTVEEEQQELPDADEQ